MYSSSKIKHQLLHEIEELSTRLNMAQQRLQKSSERQVAMEEHLQEHLETETLLIAMSARFVNLPAEEIDSEIENTQRFICEYFHFGRCSLWQIIEGMPGSLLLTHLHQIQGSPSPPEQMIISDYFPWSSSKILDGETVIISKMTDLPPEADRDRESYLKYGGTKSVVLFPLTVGKGPVFGLLGFADFHTERDWQETDIKRLMLIAQVFSNALARKQAENGLHESKMKLNMATNAAGAGLWIVDHSTGYAWVTPKTRELFNIGPDEPLNYESLFNAVHPEDYVRFHQTMQKALQSGAPLRSEFRILLPDGNLRWLNAIGQRHLRPSEASYHLMGVSLDITERKRAELSLVESLQFEKLLTEISARFINQQAELIDSEIQSALISISEFLHLDLSALWQRSGETPDYYKLSHIHSVLDSPQLLNQINQDHFPWVRQQMMANRTVIFSSIDELPAEAERDRESCILFNIKSNLTIPLFVEGKPSIGILGFNVTRAERDWPEMLIKQLELVAQIFTNALARKLADTERKQMEVQLLGYLRQIEALKQRLESENIYLRDEVKHLLEHTDIVGQSAAMEKVLTEAKQVAGTDTTVLLRGETGTGKELLARAIHRMSPRKDRALIKVNCAALPPTLIESELFGREKGAYTGAMTRMTGRFELADKSTLFLDEIGELPLDLQSKLLRVLEEGQFERLGSTKTQHVDVRIIAATNRNLEQEINNGKFRQDLFYRLNVFPVVIPPLRERPEDIPLLVRSFVKEFQKKLGKEIENIPKKTMQALQSYLWPGNVRELRNIIEHAMILCKGDTLNVDLPASTPSETIAAGKLEKIERAHIIEVLNQTGWRISGSGGAAEILGLKRTTLNSKLKKLDIRCSKSSQTK
jgi:formate hydrogenlyase transcriptional activator